jgi:superfamily II DNA or RNA helicase
MKNIRIDVGNNDSYIYGYVNPQIMDLLKEDLSYKVQNAEFTDAYNTIDPKTKKRKWDGRKRLVWKTKKSIRFPTGLLSKVRSVFDAFGVEYELTNRRPPRYQPELNLAFAEGIKLRDYQKDAVVRACKKGRGIIKAATGAGKTIIAAGIIEELKVKDVIFLAMSGDLVIQAKEEFEKFVTEDGKPIEVGMIGAGECDIKDINVATVQTICRALDVEYHAMEGDDEVAKDDKTKIALEKKKAIIEMVKNAKVIIFDEVQHAACDMVQAVMEKANDARYRFGLSASPWRDDGADLFIDSQFGQNLVDISASYLIKRGFLVKPYIKMVSMVTDRCAYNNYPSIYKRYIT